ncbi:alpha/beta fold hydrolase [Spongiactinospora rosea]|nr:alpha/beta fold hydrolase [Spongiactinospora rosea]
MLSTRLLTRPAAVAVAFLIGLPVVNVAAPAAAAEPLKWRPCATTAKDWPVPEDTKSECTMLSVPMDYAKPEGRTIKIAVSRLKAADPGKRRGVLVISPGGPGISNISAPSSYSANALRELAVDHDLVGLDPRGAGYSDKIDCPGDEERKKPSSAKPGKDEKARARASFDEAAAYNRRCVAKDPGFARQLTTTNIARDVDSIRAALGESTIDFYGVSYGTAVAVNYRSLFDHRVGRMWVESPMPPVMDLTAMDASVEAFAERQYQLFLPWLARHDDEFHFGTTTAAAGKAISALRDRLDRRPRVIDKGAVLDGDWVRTTAGGDPSSWVSNARDLATAREGGVPRSARPDPASPQVFGFDDTPFGLNAVQYNAIFCNEGAGGRDFERLWADARARERAFPMSGGLFTQFAGFCAGWPWPEQPWKPVKGTSPLQISGHRSEISTPYSWAVDTAKAAGGALLTFPDNDHGGVIRTPCSAKVIEFFRTGRTTTGTCPAAQ